MRQLKINCDICGSKIPTTSDDDTGFRITIKKEHLRQSVEEGSFVSEYLYPEDTFERFEFCSDECEQKWAIKKFGLDVKKETK